MVQRERLVRARGRVDRVHAGEALRGVAGDGQCLLEALLGEQLLGLAVEPVAGGLRGVAGIADDVQLAPRGGEVAALALDRGQPGGDLRAAVGRAAEDQLLDAVAQGGFGVGELAVAQQRVAATDADGRLEVQRSARVRVVGQRRPRGGGLLVIGELDDHRRQHRGERWPLRSRSPPSSAASASVAHSSAEPPL